MGQPPLQRLKARFSNGAIAVCLKAYPDTNREFYASCGSRALPGLTAGGLKPAVETIRLSQR